MITVVDSQEVAGLQKVNHCGILVDFQEDDVPLTKRIASISAPAKKPKLKEAGQAKKASKTEVQKKRRKAESSDRERPSKRKRGEASGKDEGKDVKWTTLSHSGVLFPPEYTAHGVKINYDGRPVDLTPEQEEVITPLENPARPHATADEMVCFCGGP